jgi:predicted aldo/keto reductase-like oxidoreductase
MKYRRFGKTELQIPVFSCGGMRFQQSWEDLPAEKVEESVQRNLEATVLRSLELGINHIETARGYGTSEMQLGWLLPKLPREKMIVQTKVEPMADPARFRKTFEQSLRNLRLGHVELLSLHGINNEETLEWSIRPGGCLEMARQLQREGLCRHVGFSTHATNNLILRAIETDGFDYVNVHWYFVNELNWSSVQAATARDMGVFIISPTDKGGMLYAPPPGLVELCAPLSPMAFNNLWCLARPEVHTLSVGAARPEDFDAHVESLEWYDRAAETVAPIEERLRARMTEVLGSEWCRHWAEGLPNYVQVPGEVNLQEILRLWTYAKGLDLTGWGKMRYNLMGNAGHWFPGANAGKADVAAIRKSVGGYRFADKLGEILAEAHALLVEAPKKRLSEGG